MASNQLKKLIAVPRDTPANKEKRRRIMADLNDHLKRLDLIGEIVSVVTYQRTKNVIRCFGRYIPSRKLFAILNLNTNTGVRHQKLSQLTSLQAGHFVQLEGFEPHWVALIGIPANDLDGKAIPFPQSPNS